MPYDTQKKNESKGETEANIDQTPSSYEGEQSQEIVEEEKQEDDNQVDFGAIPF